MTRRRGLTLIEVVASLVLISLAASTALTAYSRSLSQWHSTKELAQASALAEELIAGWRLDPPEDAGVLVGAWPDAPAWSYRRTEVRIGGSDAHPIRQWTLAVYHADETGARQAITTYTWLERSDDE